MSAIPLPTLEPWLLVTLCCNCHVLESCGKLKIVKDFCFIFLFIILELKSLVSASSY